MLIATFSLAVAGAALTKLQVQPSRSQLIEAHKVLDEGGRTLFADKNLTLEKGMYVEEMARGGWERLEKWGAATIDHEKGSVTLPVPAINPAMQKIREDEIGRLLARKADELLQARGVGVRVSGVTLESRKYRIWFSGNRPGIKSPHERPGVVAELELKTTPLKRMGAFFRRPRDAL